MTLSNYFKSSKFFFESKKRLPKGKLSHFSRMQKTSSMGLMSKLDISINKRIIGATKNFKILDNIYRAKKCKQRKGNDWVGLGHRSLTQ